MSIFWINICFFFAHYQYFLAFRFKTMAMTIIIIVIELGEILPSSVTVLQVYVTKKSVNVVRKEGYTGLGAVRLHTCGWGTWTAQGKWTVGPRKIEGPVQKT